jgi:Fe-S-cluster containining protein
LDPNPIDVVRVYHLIRIKIPVQYLDEELFFKSFIKILWSIGEDDLQEFMVTQDEYCIHCGECCVNSGLIALNQEELQLIASYLKVSINKFKNRIHIKEDGTLLMTGTPCPFYNKKSHMCTIYPVRPLVCKEFPVGKMISKTRMHRLPFIGLCKASDEVLINIIEKKLKRQHECMRA